ncbi:TonB-dependent receptor plug domain-containing protein [Mesonia ostreae]|uniref:TonB-dependent receptor plug domain-containing protein n=1 Tax=Mesonia ostreae TaxID=861110 RepID=A0ABU2KLC2_9FLAO|nr:TonB-dependent receptor plug domain-containing protein [Mesonia ostreae]MDT0295482.1 TonB-dependent receptor plug domain-containing protein [Mesonia ostreae]
MSKKLNLYLLIITGFCCSAMQAQTIKDSIALPQVIIELEANYNYNFSYADHDIKEVYVPVYSKEMPFIDILGFLEANTSLVFEIVSEKFIAITKKNDILTQEKMEELETIIISNYLARGISKKDQGTFEVNFDNFGVLPGLIEPDALQTIRALPGVESINEKISDLNIRGGTQDQNLVLWDGIRMYQSGHFFGLISAINPYMTQRVSLIKNGTSSAYGNSVSGIISLETSDKIGNDFHAEAGVNYLSIYGLVDVPVFENSSVKVAARSSINGVFKTPTYDQYYDRAFQNTEITDNEQSVKSNDAFSFYDVSLRWLYQASKKDFLRLNVIYLNNDLSFLEKAIVENEVSTKTSNLSQTSLGVGLFHKRTWSDVFQTNIQYYFSNYRLDSKNANAITSQDLKQENDVIENSFKFTTSWKLDPLLKWKNGFEYLQTRIDNVQKMSNPLSGNFSQLYASNYALFSTLSFKSNDLRTSVQLGSRLNYFKEFDTFLFEPRFSFNQKIVESLSFELLGEIKSQSSTQIIDFQNDFLGIENRRWQLSDQEEVPILKSYQLSLGIHYNKNNWLASTEAYTKKVKGITSRSQGFQNQYEYASLIGEYYIRGIDFLLKRKFGRLNAWASYSLTNNDYTFTSISEEAFDSNIEIANSLSFTTSYEYDDLKLSGGIKWRSGKHYTPISEEGLANNQFDYLATNSANLNSYVRVDFSASKQFPIHSKINAYAGISIWNVLNTKNIVNAYYERIEGDIFMVKEEGLGITPNLIFRLMF